MNMPKDLIPEKVMTVPQFRAYMAFLRDRGVGVTEGCIPKPGMTVQLHFIETKCIYFIDIVEDDNFNWEDFDRERETWEISVTT
jgi:hypothetical protein